MIFSNQFHIICVGSHKDKFVKLGVEKYSRSIEKFVRCQWTFVPPSRKKIPIEIIEDESSRISKLLLNKSLNKYFLLDDSGKVKSSVHFAKELNQVMQNASKIGFIIGGAFGVDVKLKKEINSLLSLSPLTFNHQLIRVCLIEQLYRALSIQTGSDYHY